VFEFLNKLSPYFFPNTSAASEVEAVDDDFKNGIFNDTETGLIWCKYILGPYSKKEFFEKLRPKCELPSFLGFSDWTVPSKKDLLTLNVSLKKVDRWMNFEVSKFADEYQSGTTDFIQPQTREDKYFIVKAAQVGETAYYTSAVLSSGFHQNSPFKYKLTDTGKYYVRLVRKDPLYIEEVEQESFGLTWKTKLTKKMSFAHAVERYRDLPSRPWRLPTVDELRLLGHLDGSMMEKLEGPFEKVWCQERPSMSKDPIMAYGADEKEENYYGYSDSGAHLLNELLPVRLVKQAPGKINEFDQKIQKIIIEKKEVSKKEQLEILSEKSWGNFKKLKDEVGDKDRIARIQQLYKQVLARDFPQHAKLIKVETHHIDLSGFPNFEKVTEYINIFIAARHASGQAFKLPAILLEGSCGIGKTEYLSCLCQILGVHFTSVAMAGLNSGSHLGGSQIYWGNTRHGIVFETLVLEGQANPMIFIDEIDKAGKGGSSTNGGNATDPLSALYGLLEPTTAVSFEDASLPGVRFDASRVSWVASANDASVLDTPIRSRFMLFKVQAPSREQMRVIVPQVYASIKKREEWHDYLDDDLPDQTVEALLDFTPREVRLALLPACARAVGNCLGNATLNASDIQASKTGGRIGFF
jgi:hypothetical protein